MLTFLVTISMVKAEIVAQAKEFKINPITALSIAACESSFNPLAKNPNSSASGIFQWTLGTWKWIGAKGDRLNYQDNIREFMKWYPLHKNWWKSCLTP